MSRIASDITGRGIVSSLGQSVEAFSTAVVEGRCAIAPIPDLLSIQKFKCGAPIRDFVGADHFDDKELSILDPFTQFAAVAARQAWRESGLDHDRVNPERIAVVIGSANGGIDIEADAYRRIFIDDSRPRPLTIPMGMSSAPASRIAREIGARGPVFAISSACASAAHAVLIGDGLIRAGLADVAVVGGTDCCFTDSFLRAWDSMRVVSADTCRPFSKGRLGLILGEGAGVIILEKAGRAQGRGNRVVARFLGGGMTSDAGDLVAPDPLGMARAMRLALADGGIAADEVDYVNAHGTGTLANDRAESAAILDVFGSRSTPVPVSSTKSMIGHALGASGALEAVATLAALERGVIPPTLNFIEPDPDCAIDVTPNAPRPAPLNTALSNSFAFGGLNVSLAFARTDTPRS